MSEEKWKCPNCGAENAMDDNLCGECGGKKPVVGTGMAQTVNKQEAEEKDGAIDELTSAKPKKKGAGKIVLILVAICVVLIVCGVVVNIAEQQRLAEQQRQGGKIGTLYWSKRSFRRMTWRSAKEYCKDLTEGGYSDWRLPTISELRTTIKNCPSSQSGGSCKVSDSCLSDNCWSGSCYCGCISDCPYSYDNDNGGYYSKLGDDDVALWSSSVRSDNTHYRWYVSFGNGSGSVSVTNYHKSSTHSVRCVR
ncbi:DUF1566 domain-containing protein [bacterium]|nr:DUF1566 domain-containing protein [bacterium]